MNHGKPISESTPSRRTFNTPNAAGVSRDTDAGPDSDQPPTSTGQQHLPSAETPMEPPPAPPPPADKPPAES